MLAWIRRLGRSIVKVLKDFLTKFRETAKEQFTWTFLKPTWSKVCVALAMAPLAIWMTVWHVGIAAAVASGLVDIFVVEPIRRMLNLGPVLNVCLSVAAFVTMWFLMVNIAEVTCLLVAIGLVMEADAAMNAITAGKKYFVQQWQTADATN